MTAGYLLARCPSEAERLRLQAETWEPAARTLLADLDVKGGRAVDLGCGPLGWLRVLSEAVGPAGMVVGTDVDPHMLAAARALLDEDGVGNVELILDDLFSSGLEPASFTLVHARFQIAALGRAKEQVELCRRLAAPDGLVVLEEPDSSSWHFNPPAPAAERLIDVIVESFRLAGADFDAGRTLPALLADAGMKPSLRAQVLALPPSHPYLRLPLQFAESLGPRLAEVVGPEELLHLRTKAEAELRDDQRWGTGFTLVQAWASGPER